MIISFLSATRYGKKPDISLLRVGARCDSTELPYREQTAVGFRTKFESNRA